MTEPATRKPFEGVTILDFTRVLAGPYCTALLADQGARVIKVEPPGGDDQRAMGAFRDGLSLSFEMINRNKRSLRLDLRNPEGRAIAGALAERADVVIENFRPGVADRLGIGPAALTGANPRLIYCSISGFGQDGPMAAMPAYDVVIQALSGMMSITGMPEGPPMLVGESIADITAGLYAAQAISAALYRREASGTGAVLDVAMFDTLFSLLPTALAMWQRQGETPPRSGNRHPLSAPFGLFQAADAPVIIAVANPALFAALAEAIGRGDLCNDPRFATDRLRRANADALQAEIERWTRRLSADAVVERLAAAGVPVSRVRDVAHAATSDHAQARGLLHAVSHPALGPLRLPEQPVRFAGAPRGAPRRAPDLGADGGAILSEMLDLPEAEIARLRERNII